MFTNMIFFYSYFFLKNDYFILHKFESALINLYLQSICFLKIYTLQFLSLGFDNPTYTEIFNYLVFKMATKVRHFSRSF